MPIYSITATEPGQPDSVLEARQAPGLDAAKLISATLERQYPDALVTIAIRQEKSPMNPVTSPAIADPHDLPVDIAPIEAPRTRRRRVASIEIPEELHALAVLTGRDPAEMICDLMAAQIVEVKRRASAILTEAAR